MTETVTNDALYDGTNQIIVDVRSPGEYEVNHIYHAINIPLFTDEERAAIGTAYKKQSTFKAKKLGLTYISYKIESIGHQLLDLHKKYDRVIVYCQKGGMRSQSICDLMNALDITVFKLEGGMKGHRQYILDETAPLLSERTFVTLHGLTGVGKTKILEGIKEKGLSILNYEKMAQNAGSVFGTILFRGQPPTQKFFEEELFYLTKTSSSKYIFIESESKRVGGILIPDEYMNQLEIGKHILVETNLDKRTENLIEDYVVVNGHEDLITAMNKLRKRISNDKVDELIEYIKNDTLEPLVQYLLVDYYDPLYQYSINKYKYDYKINYKDINEAIEEIVDIYQKGI